MPHDERIDANAEVLNQFIKSIEFPDREEVESYLPTLTKASYLEPFFEQYVIGNRRTPTHTAILYLNEYGIVDRGDGTSRYLEKPSIGGFRFLKDVVTNTDISPDLRTSRHLPSAEGSFTTKDTKATKVGIEDLPSRFPW